MIFSGRKRSATARAKRRITRMGISAPRYQRAVLTALVGLLGIGVVYSVPATGFNGANETQKRPASSRTRGHPVNGAGKQRGWEPLIKPLAIWLGRQKHSNQSLVRA